MRTLTLTLLAFGFVGLALATAGGDVFPSDQDRLTDDIVAESADGPNGVYADIDDDGDLEIDLTETNEDIEGDGVNPQSLTGVDDVFTITYTGEEFVHVWLEHDADTVEFYVNPDDPASVEGKANTVSLEPNESIDVGFSADSHGTDVGESIIDEISINAKLPDDDPDQPRDGDPAPPRNGETTPPVDPCPAGPSVDVDAPKKTTRAVSIADTDPCQTASVDLLGLEVGPSVTLETLEADLETNEDVTLEVGRDTDRKATPFDKPTAATVGDFAVGGPDDAATDVEYQLAIDAGWLERSGIEDDDLGVYAYDDEWIERDIERVGEDDHHVRYTFSDGGVTRYTLAVDAPTLELEEPSVNRTTVEPGETVTVTGTLRAHDETAAATVSLRAAGEEVATESMTVPANDSVGFEFEYVVTEATTLELVAEDSREWVDVQTLETIEVDNAEPTDDEQPGPTPGQAIAGLAAVTLLALLVARLYRYQD